MSAQSILMFILDYYFIVSNIKMMYLIEVSHNKAKHIDHWILYEYSIRSSAGSDYKTALDWVLRKWNYLILITWSVTKIYIYWVLDLILILIQSICLKYLLRLGDRSNIKIRSGWAFKKYAMLSYHSINLGKWYT